MMRVLHAAAEVFPLVKTGGLADAIAGLLPALTRGGVQARLLLPGLPAVLEGVGEAHPIAELGAAFGAARLTLLQARLPGREGIPVYVLDAPWLYDRPGNPYLGPNGSEWPDNAQRFAALGWAAAHLAAGRLDAQWQPQLLHCHDWHAALAMAWLAHHPARLCRTVFTVHNLAYQGSFALEDHRELGLSPSWLSDQGLEFHGRGNFMKAGLVWSDALTTVSPRYAREICTPAFGCGLEGVLSMRREQLSGILNGVDTAVWDPARDPNLAEPFDRDRLPAKARCKAQLQRMLGLTVDADRVLFTVVSRLTDQKGMDLLLAALPAMLRAGGQLALLGSGDRLLEQAFTQAAAAHPGQVAVRIGYDEALSHQLIGSADAIIVPSRFEPCGLTQLYGLRYGTLPVVRRVGGLADTVIDAGPGSTPGDQATGFVFEPASADALAQALGRAIDIYRNHPLNWQMMMRRALATDFSWDTAARSYQALYTRLLQAPLTPIPARTSE